MEKETKNHNENISNNGKQDELIHAISDLADAFKNLQKTSHENLLAEIEDRKAVRKMSITNAYIVPLIMAFNIITGVLLYSYWAYRKDDSISRQHEITVLYSEYKELDRRIDYLYSKRDNLMKSMTNIREARAYKKSLCKKGDFEKYNSPQKDAQVYSAGYDLVANAFSVDGVFNNDVIKKILSFEAAVSVDNGRKICSKNSASDEDLRAQQIAINNAINNQIKLLEVDKKRLNQKIGKIYGLENKK